MKRIRACLVSCLCLLAVCVLFARESNEKTQQKIEYTADSLGVSDEQIVSSFNAMYVSGTNPRKLTEYRLLWDILLDAESREIAFKVDQRTPFQSAETLENYFLTAFHAAQQYGIPEVAGDFETKRLIRDVLKKRQERAARKSP